VTGTVSAIVAVSCTGGVGFLVQQVTPEPWWIAVIVVPLAGFSVWLVRWILQQQSERDKADAVREANREKREDKRAENAELQTQALRECVSELKRLHQEQTNQTAAIAALPGLVVARLDERDIQ